MWLKLSTVAQSYNETIKFCVFFGSKNINHTNKFFEQKTLRTHVVFFRTFCDVLEVWGLSKSITENCPSTRLASYECFVQGRQKYHSKNFRNLSNTSSKFSSPPVCLMLNGILNSLQRTNIFCVYEMHSNLLLWCIWVTKTN